MKPNIYDIAQEAGVSIATVSRVLNGKEGVGEQTRKRVQQVLERRGYTPNDIARGLALRNSRMVGIVMEDVRNVHYSHTAYAAEQELSAQGYQSILCNATAPMRAEYFRMLASKQVDGLILIGSVFVDNKIAALLDDHHAAKPVVMVNGSLPLPNVYSVSCDDRHGSQLCVDHLVAQGRRSLVYLQSLTTNSAREKVEGFRTSVLRHGISEACHILELTHTFESAEALADHIVSLEADGIICGEDLVAMGVINGLRRLGKHIPEDYAVTGYNNSFFGKLSDQKLTSVDNQPGQMGTESARMLCNALRGEQVARQVLLRPSLFIGTTT